MDFHDAIRRFATRKNFSNKNFQKILTRSNLRVIISMMILVKRFIKFKEGIQ